MQLFFAVIIFLLIFATIVVMVIFNYLRKGVKRFTQTMTGDVDDEEAFRRMTDKHYRKKDTNSFDADYFKSASPGGSTAGHGRQQAKGGQGRQQQEQPRHTTTQQDGGVTIIDERNQQEVSRKIFTEDEGEYVDFKEES